MKPLRFFVYLIALGLTFLPIGCNPKETHEHHEEEEADGHEEEHEHDESSSAASFKPNEGVFLTDETKIIISLEVADVAQEKLPKVIRLNVQIFGETHRFAHSELDHTACDVHGAGFLPPDQAALVEINQPVKLLSAENEALEGFVVSVQKALAHGETEIVVGVTSAGEKLKDGEFVTATIVLPRDLAVNVIPSSALLRTIEGTFVYKVNGNAYHRTSVKTGSEADGKIEIIDGLSLGDQVVTKPVETLWLIELRATKGGGHSH